MRVLFLGASFLVMFSGCLTEKTSKVEQSKITADYKLHYDDSDRTVIGEVQFTTRKKTEGSTFDEPVYLELDNNSYVYFSGDLMVQTKNMWDQIRSVRRQSHD